MRGRTLSSSTDPVAVEEGRSDAGYLAWLDDLNASENPIYIDGDHIYQKRLVIQHPMSWHLEKAPEDIVLSNQFGAFTARS